MERLLSVISLPSRHGTIMPAWGRDLPVAPPVPSVRNQHAAAAGRLSGGEIGMGRSGRAPSNETRRQPDRH